MKWLGFPPKDYSLLILLPSTPPTLRPSFLSLSLSLLLPSAHPSSLSPFHYSYPPPVFPLLLPFTPPTLRLSFLSLSLSLLLPSLSLSLSLLTSAHPSLPHPGELGEVTEAWLARREWIYFGVPRHWTSDNQRSRRDIGSKQHN